MTHFSSCDILIEQKEIELVVVWQGIWSLGLGFLHGLESFLQPWWKDEDGEPDQNCCVLVSGNLREGKGGPLISFCRRFM